MIKARVKETSVTTGTGTLNLDGAVSGFRSFVNAFGTAVQCYYVIVDGTAWEVGIGTVTSGSPNTLSRTTVLDSSAAGVLLTLGVGTKSVFNDMPATVLLAEANFAKAIYGLTYANNAVDATNDIDILAGGCTDGTAVRWLVGPALTKRLDANWVVGTNQGGLDTGTIGNSDYYLWIIARSDTGVVDYLFSLSSTAPTMPANYNFKRLIGWFKRVSAAIVAFHTYETEGGGIELLWDTPTLDVNLASTLTTTRRTDAVKVPLNVSVVAWLSVVMSDASASQDAVVYCPDQADINPTVTGANIHSTSTVYAVVSMSVRTSATGTIAARSTLATVDGYLVTTMGFQWSRRN